MNYPRCGSLIIVRMAKSILVNAVYQWVKEWGSKVELPQRKEAITHTIQS